MASRRSRSASLDQRLMVTSTGEVCARVVMLLTLTANAVNFSGAELDCAAIGTVVMAARHTAASVLNMLTDLRLWPGSANRTPCHNRETLSNRRRLTARPLSNGHSGARRGGRGRVPEA